MTTRPRRKPLPQRFTESEQILQKLPPRVREMARRVQAAVRKLRKESTSADGQD